MDDTITATWSDTTFRAMGSRCRLLVRGGPRGLTATLIGRIGALEAAWSRFRPDSEVSRVNSLAGYHVIVGTDTLRLFLAAQAGWYTSEGWFDPLMLSELEAAGYDRSHEELEKIPMADPSVGIHPEAAETDSEGGPSGRWHRSPMEHLEIDEAVSAVTLPVGSRFDPGGIGKGLAADMVIEDAIHHGVESVLVDLGGDLRVHGSWSDDETWPVLVGHPADPDRDLAELAIPGGAVATSGRRRRRWRSPDGRVAHHLLDPHTAVPSLTELEAVTVHAGTAWYAEVLAKAALLAGPSRGRELIERTQTSALLVAGDGSVEIVGPLAVRRLDP